MNSDAHGPTVSGAGKVPHADDRPGADDHPDADDHPGGDDEDTVLIGQGTEPGGCSLQSVPELADDEPTRIVVREPTADDEATRIVTRGAEDQGSTPRVAPARGHAADEASGGAVAPQPAFDDDTIIADRRSGELQADLGDETMISDPRGTAAPNGAPSASSAVPPMGLIAGGRVYQAPDVASGAKEAQPRRAATPAPVHRVELPTTSDTLPAPADQLRAAATKRERRRGAGVLVAVVASTVLVGAAAVVAIWLIATLPA